jgi:hypothetical protein
MKIGQGKALKNKWITKDGQGFIRAVSPVFDLSGHTLLSILSFCFTRTFIRC